VAQWAWQEPRGRQKEARLRAEVPGEAELWRLAQQQAPVSVQSAAQQRQPVAQREQQASAQLRASQPAPADVQQLAEEQRVSEALEAQQPELERLA